MNKKRRCTISVSAGLIFFCLVVATGAGEVIFPVPVSLQRLLEQTDANNDRLRQLEAEIEALLDEVPAARALDDPVLSLGINALPTDTFSFSQEPMTQKQIFIAQKFPWFGKLDLKSQKVALAAAKKTEMRQALMLELHRVVSETYFELAFIDRSLEVNAELQQMVKQILKFAEAAYASGRGLQQDVLQAQVENGKLIDEETTLVSRKRILDDQLNELVNGPGFTPVDTQGIPPLADPGLIDEVLARNAIALNPDLAALAVDIETAEVDIKLTRKNYWLDMSVALGYGLREEDLTGRDLPNFLDGFVTCILPAWFKKKQNKKLLAAMNRKAAAKPPGQRDTP